MGIKRKNILAIGLGIGMAMASSNANEKTVMNQYNENIVNKQEVSELSSPLAYFWKKGRNVIFVGLD